MIKLNYIPHYIEQNSIMQDIFTDFLKKTGITKAQLARELGVSARQVSKWQDNPPQYAIAYLELKYENKRLLSLIKNLNL